MSFRQPGKSLKFPALLLTAASFLSQTPMRAQVGYDMTWTAKGHGNHIGVDVLSDTQGVDFGPYLAKTIRTISDPWKKRIADETDPSIAKGGQTIIHLTIRPDGTIAGMRVEAGGHDSVLDRAAWSSITQAQSFAPLPAGFTGASFELRMHFEVPPAPKAP